MKCRIAGAMFVLVFLAVIGNRAWAASDSELRLDIEIRVKSETNIEINRVDILGVRAFSAELIESSLVIGPGDLFDREKVLRTQENLQLLYKRRGYEGIGIKIRLVRKTGPNNTLETVLE